MKPLLLQKEIKQFWGGGGVGASFFRLDYFQCLYALAINDTMKKVNVDSMTKLRFQTKCQKSLPVPDKD